MDRKTPTRLADEVVLYTNPTHLERSSAFLLLSVWAFCAVAGGYGVILWHAPLLLILPPLVVLGLVALTTESATDVGAVGVIAGTLRARLGSRSAIEWANARAHYFRLAEWPIWRARCEAFYRSLRARTRSLRTIRRKLTKR